MSSSKRGVRMGGLRFVGHSPVRIVVTAIICSLLSEFVWVSVPAFFFGRFRFGFGVDVVVGLCVLYCVEKLLVLKNVKVMSFFV